MAQVLEQFLLGLHFKRGVNFFSRILAYYKKDKIVSNINIHNRNGPRLYM